MADKRSIAIVVGACLGVAAVATAVGVYVSRRNHPMVRNVNDVFDEARRTLDKLDKAVETIRATASV